MAQVIRISRFDVKRLLGDNLRFYQEHQQRYGGTISMVYPDKYCIQFDPQTLRYAPVLWSGSKKDFVDLKPGWRFVQIPQPMSDYELHALDEAINSGGTPFLGADEFIFQIVTP